MLTHNENLFLTMSLKELTSEMAKEDCNLILSEAVAYSKVLFYLSSSAT